LANRASHLSRHPVSELDGCCSRADFNRNDYKPRGTPIESASDREPTHNRHPMTLGRPLARAWKTGLYDHRPQIAGASESGIHGLRTPVDRRQRARSPALAFVNWAAGGRCYSELPVPQSPDCHAGNGPRIANRRGRFIWCRAAPARFRFMRLTPISRASIRVFGFCNFW
jgi:hypothetical protein